MTSIERGLPRRTDPVDHESADQGTPAPSSLGSPSARDEPSGQIGGLPRRPVRSKKEEPGAGDGSTPAISAPALRLPAIEDDARQQALRGLAAWVPPLPEPSAERTAESFEALPAWVPPLSESSAERTAALFEALSAGVSPRSELPAEPSSKLLRQISDALRTPTSLQIAGGSDVAATSQPTTTPLSEEGWADLLREVDVRLDLAPPVQPAVAQSDEPKTNADNE
ncbi:hypothetical protein LJR230_003946 [Trinickia sp. LjRoot230]|uniref:hypothetical protein n=1 Tax=Trinickia sp. LjRoot230 TaxID=3342288 RepID=UPI003ED1639B